MMVAIIIQARMGSSRLPGKIMKNLAGHEVLWQVVNRCQKSSADKIIIATTTNAEDDVIERFCVQNNLDYFRGSSENVLERYYLAAKKYKADIVVRITSDCPLIDPGIIDLCLEKFKKNKYDYLSNVVPGDRTFPRGLDVEVFSFSALKRAYQQAKENYEKEHVTPYIWENKKGEFRIGPMIIAGSEYARNYRLTLDYPEDLRLISKIYEVFYREGKIIPVPEALKWLDEHPDIAEINAQCAQKTIK